MFSRASDDLPIPLLAVISSSILILVRSTLARRGDGLLPPPVLAGFRGSNTKQSTAASLPRLSRPMVCKTFGRQVHSGAIKVLSLA